jgi:hypothetical protein
MAKKYRWKIFARKLLNRHYRMNSLEILMKFRYLAVKLLEKYNSGT